MQKDDNIPKGELIQRLFNIDLLTYLVIYYYRWSKR